jgi:hypothetical protein
MPTQDDLHRPSVSTPTAPPISESSAARQVDLSRDDVPCLNCGYNLRGLPSDGACPECGAPVQRSLQGNLLIYSSAGYLAALHRGLICIISAVLAQIGLTVVLVIGVILSAAVSQSWQGQIQIWVNVISIPIAALSLYGWWLFSAPDPAVIGGDTGGRPRQIIRITVIVVAICTLMSLSAFATREQSIQAEVLNGAAALIMSVAGIAQFFASMMYIKWLAPRLPDKALAARASKYMWMLPLIYVVGACAAFIGPLVATIMYLVMLNRIRLQLRELRERQAVEYPSAMLA